MTVEYGFSKLCSVLCLLLKILISLFNLPEPKVGKIERNDMTTEPQNVSTKENVTSVSQQDQPTTAPPSQPQQHNPTENNPDYVPLEGITIITHDGV